MLLHPLAKDHCRSGHEMQQVQETLYDPRHDTLPSSEQFQREFVTAKGNGSHVSLLRLLRSGMTVAQVQCYIEGEVQKHYLKLKANYIDQGTFSSVAIHFSHLLLLS